MSGVLLFGSTDLSLAVAETLTAAGIPLAGVVTLPAQFSISYSRRPVSNLRAVDMGAWAMSRGVPYLTYSGVEGVMELIDAVKPQLGLAAGWYHMIPRRVREAVPQGVLGLHASLLPRLRGGAPLNWAILNGEAETGVSLFVLGDGVDDGPLFGQERLPIGPRTTVTELLAAVTQSSCDMVSRLFPAILEGHLGPQPQEGMASYGLQRQPEDGLIDWTASAAAIDRLVRSQTRPYSGAYSFFDDERLTIWAAEPAVGAPEVLGQPGQIAVIAELPGPAVLTGAGLLLVHEVTREDGSDAMGWLGKAGHRRFTPFGNHK